MGPRSAIFQQDWHGKAEESTRSTTFRQNRPSTGCTPETQTAQDADGSKQRNIGRNIAFIGPLRTWLLPDRRAEINDDGNDNHAQREEVFKGCRKQSRCPNAKPATRRQPRRSAPFRGVTGWEPAYATVLRPRRYHRPGMYATTTAAPKP